MSSVQLRARIDAGAPVEPLRPIWRAIGYDEPNYTYTPAGRELLAKLRGMSAAPYFVRCHFLLCNGDGTPALKWGSTDVYREERDGTPRFDWRIVDRIFDTYLELGHLPFVELGFTPEPLSPAPADVPYESARLGSAWSYPPRDLAKWQGLVGALVEHCVQRYGLREVTAWRWELWNEPDIAYFTGTVEQYCALFDATEEAIHSRYPMLLLGGPATTNPASPKAAAFLTGFLDHCAGGRSHAGGRRLDFITFHAKGANLSREPGAPKQTPTIDTLVGHVRAGLEIVAGYPSLADREIVISECDPDGWAAGTRADNPNLEYRNSEYYASYLATTICELLPLGAPDSDEGRASPVPRIDSALTWAFEFEGRELFEGLRSLSTNGVDKPVLNSFRLLERLGPLLLSVEPHGAGTEGWHGNLLPTRWEDGRMAVLIASHHDDWEVRSPVEVEIELTGLQGEGLEMAVARVDSQRANAYAAWRAIGSPARAEGTVIEHLQGASRLQAEGAELPVDGGRATIRLTVEQHSVTLITLSPRGER